MLPHLSCMNPLREVLLVLARRYMDATGCSLTTVSRRAVNDWRFLTSVERGRNFTSRRGEDAIAWFALNWPASAEWPPEIKRPWTSEARERLQRRRERIAHYGDAA
jgi:hypothetical protein